MTYPVDPESRRPTTRARLFSLVAMLLAGAGAPPQTDDLTDPSADVLILRRCPVDYERSATMGSSQYGLIQECLVAPGDRVKAGQLLGRLRDDDLRAELKLRELEAGSDVEIR